ncbi:MAG: phytoene desaturase [Chitinophagales bacterium]|nr:phytoene desaturase [Chitinophagales bacterium]
MKVSGKKAIIIGSGVGGLATSIRLANKGYNVTVYEQNSYPGGKLTEIDRNGFRFDAGPSLFTLPELLDDLFIESGKAPGHYYSYKQVEIITRYFYPDGVQISAYSDPKRFASELEDKAGEPSSNVLNFLSYSKEIYELTKFIFLDRSLNVISTYLQKGTLNTLLNINKIDALRTMNNAIESKFKTSKARQLFARYATYNGSNPYKAPATLNIIAHLEHNCGAYFLDGGMHKVTESLYKLALEQGVQFNFGKEVDGIQVENGKAKSIKIGKDIYDAEIVVSNMDIHPTYRRLMPEQKAPERVLKQEKSTSALIYYWGMSKEFPEFDLHNILFSGDYKTEFDTLNVKKDISDDPTVYIYISKKECPEDAPAGKENWFVMINAPHIDGQNWDELIDRSRRNIINKISQTLGYSIQDYIEFEEKLTPELIQSKTSSYLGALYGNSSNNMLAAFLRHPNFSRKIKNLYFCGGSVHPGGGVPLCLSSAKIIDGLI